jgi:hypothetical protein
MVVWMTFSNMNTFFLRLLARKMVYTIVNYQLQRALACAAASTNTTISTLHNVAVVEMVAG